MAASASCEHSFPFAEADIVANLGKGRFSEVLCYRVQSSSQEALEKLETAGKLKHLGFVAVKSYAYWSRAVADRDTREQVHLRGSSADSGKEAEAEAEGEGGARAAQEADVLRRITGGRSLTSSVSSSHSDENNPYITQLLLSHHDPATLRRRLVLTAALGGSLHKHILRSAGGCGFYITVARDYAAEVVSALSHMRRHHCMHRDLKANNIVLTHRGHVMLVDLGSAKYLEPPSISSSPTGGPAIDVLGNFIYHDPNADRSFPRQRSYSLVGTAHAMAPEMVAGSGHSFPADWWSLGVLIHEMLSGAPPRWKHRDSLDGSPAAPDPSMRTGIAKHVIDHARNMLQSAATGVIDENISQNQAKAECSVGRGRDGETHTLSGCWDWLHTGDQELPCYCESSLGEAARDLVSGLLQVHPSKRLFLTDVQRHPFFRGTSWIDVHAGLSACPWPDFDKRLGFIDLVEDDKSCAEGDGGLRGLGQADDELTAEQQALFADF